MISNSYVEFQSGHQRQVNIDFSYVDFVELYNCTEDRWQMNNLIPNPLKPNLQTPLHDDLHQWSVTKSFLQPRFRKDVPLFLF